jgi:hypothetical protein
VASADHSVPAKQQFMQTEPYRQALSACHCRLLLPHLGIAACSIAQTQ